jgi:hypothetical protein
MTPEQRAEWRAEAEAQSTGKRARRILALLDALDATEARVAEVERELASVIEDDTEKALLVGALTAKVRAVEALLEVDAHDPYYHRDDIRAALTKGADR